MTEASAQVFLSRFYLTIFVKVSLFKKRKYLLGLAIGEQDKSVEAEPPIKSVSFSQIPLETSQKRRDKR